MASFPIPLSDFASHRFSQLLYRCFEEVGATKAVLYLCPKDEHAFFLASHYGWPRHTILPEQLESSEPLLSWVRRERHAVVVSALTRPAELEAFQIGPENGRFMLSPLYSRGELAGLLIQRDLMKNASFDLVRDTAKTKPILDAIYEAMEEIGIIAPLSPPPPDAPPETPQTPAPITVAVPASAALGASSTAGPTQIREAAEPEPFPQETMLGLEEDGEAHDPRRPRRPGLFLPEQRTYFWETARLLCSFVPLGAAALWMDDARELRPMLLYSRLPLGDDLKRQTLAALGTHVPDVPAKDFRVLSQVEWPDRDPLPGPFLTYLPMVLKEAEGVQDLLLLFRMEDRPFTPHEQTFLQHVARILGYHIQEMRIHERYHRAFLSVSQRMLASAEGRVPTLMPRSVAIARLARKFAVRLDLPAADVESVSIAAILHDVGTVFLDPQLLTKPTFTQEDKARVKAHPILSTSFLKDFRFPFDVLSVIRHHHERWDGTGYPDGLVGDKIPLGSRIIALAESYEVMTKGRPHKEPRPMGDVIAEIERESGKQFDPQLVPEFIRLVSKKAPDSAP